MNVHVGKEKDTRFLQLRVYKSKDKQQIRSCLQEKKKSNLEDSWKFAIKTKW